MIVSICYKLQQRQTRSITSALPFVNFQSGFDMDINIQPDLFHQFALRAKARAGVNEWQL